MARSPKRTPPVETVRPYVAGVAKNLVDKIYGPNGPAWGTKRTTIEDLLLQIRAVLTETRRAETLARQAAPGRVTAPDVSYLSWLSAAHRCRRGQAAVAANPRWGNLLVRAGRLWGPLP